MEIPKPHLLIMFLFGVFRATRADASAEIAVAVLKSGEGPASSSPPCSLWTRGGSMLPEQISLIHREAGRPVLNVDSMDGIIIGRLPCIPCFSLVSGARTDMGKMGLEAGRVRNKCNKIPHINFTILLLGSINSTLANYSRKHSAPTHLVRRIGLGSNAIEIKTVCPNGQVRSGSIWRVEQLESHMSSKCPHPLIGTRQRVSILGSLPYVNPAGLYGSDVDLMGIIADKLSFELDFKVERSFSNIIEGVANGTSAFGLGHLVIEYRSTAVVDLTHPPYQFEMVVATAKPKPLTPFFNLLRPFSLTVWVLVTLAIPITMGVLYFMFAKPELDNLNAKVWSCFQCVFGSMAGQGLFLLLVLKNVQKVHFYLLVLLPQGVPFSQKFGRRHFALVWIWLLYVNLVQMAYESNFRASLIDPKLENAVDSDLELYETGRDMYFARVGKQLPYFAQSPLPHRRALASRAVENKLLYACTPKGCPNVPELYSIISKGSTRYFYRVQ